MGEKKNEGKGGDKKEGGGITTVVLKMDLHCEGCGSKVVKSVKKLDGMLAVSLPSVEDFIVFVFEVNGLALFWFGFNFDFWFFFFWKFCVSRFELFCLFSFLLSISLFFCIKFFAFWFSDKFRWKRLIDY